MRKVNASQNESPPICNAEYVQLIKQFWAHRKHWRRWIIYLRALASQCDQWKWSFRPICPYRRRYCWCRLGSRSMRSFWPGVRQTPISSSRSATQINGQMESCFEKHVKRPPPIHTITIHSRRAHSMRVRFCETRHGAWTAKTARAAESMAGRSGEPSHPECYGPCARTSGSTESVCWPRSRALSLKLIRIVQYPYVYTHRLE